MRKRLIWNFEIDGDRPLEIPEALPAEPDSGRWESRFFWSSKEVILLNGLDDRFLALSRYEAKHRQDTYCLLPDTDYNIKIRRNQTLYKPMIMKTAQAVAYGKKINLEASSPETLNNTLDLLGRIQREGVRIDVDKEAFIYRFETTPKTKLELARLSIANTIYFSLCIESRSRHLVELITKQVTGEQVSSDYVSFLRTL